MSYYPQQWPHPIAADLLADHVLERERRRRQQLADDRAHARYRILCAGLAASFEVFYRGHRTVTGPLVTEARTIQQLAEELCR